MSEKKVLIDVHTSSNIHEKKSVPTQWLTGVFLMRNYVATVANHAIAIDYGVGL